MSRRRRAEKREVSLEPLYQNKNLSKFINYVMLHGKKDLAQKLVYDALSMAAHNAKIGTKTEKTEDGAVRELGPIDLFAKAIENASPQVEVKSRRIGGSTYQVPVEVAPGRQFMLASNWIIAAARSKSGKSFDKRLADILLASYNGQGEAVSKKDNVHKMAEANKAFAHYRF